MRRYFIGLFACVLASSGSESSVQAQAAKTELERIEARFKEERNAAILSAQMWTLAHAAAEAEKNKAIAVFGLDEGGQLSIKTMIERAGGIEEYRKKVTLLLANNDEFVRGFAAVWLGILGQRESVADLMKLLRSNLPVQRPSSEGNDRGRAAMGLGLLGAQDHAPDLAAQLKSPNSHLRAGAALGLGYMKAVKFAPDVAETIKRRDNQIGEDQALIAALGALAEMGAKDQADQIAWVLRSNRRGDPAIQPAAMYALVRLKATDHAKDIVPSLKDRFRKGDAAKALALLNAQSYKKDIATLLDDENTLNRCAGMIALGILRAKEYEDKVAKQLEAPEGYVHWYAGWSLILMESEKHVGKIRMRPDASALHGSGAAQIANDEFRQVRERAFESWKRLTGNSGK